MVCPLSKIKGKGCIGNFHSPFPSPHPLKKNKNDLVLLSFHQMKCVSGCFGSRTPAQIRLTIYFVFSSIFLFYLSIYLFFTFVACHFLLAVPFTTNLSTSFINFILFSHNLIVVKSECQKLSF